MVRPTGRAEFHRRSIPYFRSVDTSGSKAWASLYGHMFVEDVQSHVMPIGAKSRSRKDFGIALDPYDGEIDKVLRNAFPANRDHPARSVTEAVSSFIQDWAPSLCTDGVVHFELTESSHGGKIGSQTETAPVARRSIWQFRPVRIPGRVLNLGRVHLQLAPLLEWREAARPYAFIPSDRVWTILIPKELGRPREQRRMLRSLMRLSSPVPAFVQAALQRQEKVNIFSFGEFHTLQVGAVAQVTGKWGWPARMLWRDSALEYYLVYRHVRFAGAMAILREHMVRSINSLLRRLHVSSQLVIRGLPSSPEISGLLERMEGGELSFAGAFESTQIG